MIRVLQIAKYYYPFIGGVEQVVEDVSDALKLAGVQQKIICFNENCSDGTHVYRRYETIREDIDGVEIVRCGCAFKIASQSLSASYGRELKKLMNEFRPDVVILHYPNPYVTEFLMKYTDRNFKLLLYWHLDITKQKILKKVFHNQTIRLVKRADYVIGPTPTHVNKSEYAAYFEGKKYILPFKVDENSLQISDGECAEAEKVRQKYAGEKIGFFIGRHVEYKGLEYLIKASKKLGNEKVRFLIAGSGELTEKLKKMAAGDDKVIFLGQISESDRRVYLKACDFFCFPSITKNENFGLAQVEAMYFGKPAVTFTIPGSGVNYVNQNGVTGLECPNRDVDALAQALHKLVNDDELRLKLGANARTRVMNEFSEDVFNRNVQGLLESLFPEEKFGGLG